MMSVRRLWMLLLIIMPVFPLRNWKKIWESDNRFDATPCEKEIVFIKKGLAYASPFSTAGCQ